MRSFIAAVFLSAAAINGAMLYRPAPAKAAPVQVASWLKTDKVQDRLPTPAVKTIPFRLDPPVEKTKLRSTAGLPWTCEQVRKATEGLSPRQIEQLARIHRLNHEQRAEARRCMKENRS